MDRLIDELRKQHEEILQTLKKASLLVLAERDLRTRETEQIRADLNTLYDVLERNLSRLDDLIARVSKKTH